jgi:hypothetical protein
MKPLTNRMIRKRLLCLALRCAYWLALKFSQDYSLLHISPL